MNKKLAFLIIYPALAISLAFASVGCSSSSAPKTFPVKGIVKYANGKPLAKGTITLRSKSDTKIVGSGTIEAGGFSIKTSVDGEMYSGAPAGEYSVMVMIEIPDDTQASYHPVDIAKTYRVEEKENDFTITLPQRK